jgi:hypothetical protein
MANLVVTAANVVRGAGAKIEVGTLGTVVTAGQGVVKDPVTGNFVPASANHATAALRRTRGVALNGGSINQPVAVQYEGPITIGAVVVVGAIYVQAAAAGGIAPAADLASGHEVTVLGVGISASQIALKVHNAQAVVP